VSRFQFVADHRHAFEVKRLCELVQVARSSFYAWLGAAPTRAARVAADAELADRIRRLHEADRTQGVSRITAELNDGVGRGRGPTVRGPGPTHFRLRYVRRCAGRQLGGLFTRLELVGTLATPAAPGLLHRRGFCWVGFLGRGPE
jgi:hypothetical protein